MKTALLVSTYNWPQALELVLNSLETQTTLPDELLIADDGSGEETKKIIALFIKKEILPVKHIWQEDDGFRRSSILNKAIAQSDADYIIQTDGDCIIHQKFIEDHIAFATKGQYLFGSRVNILQEHMEPLFRKKQIVFNTFSKGIKNRTRNLHIPLLSNFYGTTDTLSRKLRGCNLSFWRSDFIAINGYNEDMTGWGREDSELVTRFINQGLIGRRLRYRAIIYHIWHKTSSKSSLTINEEIQKKALNEKWKRCDNGINKYL